MTHGRRLALILPALACVITVPAPAEEHYGDAYDRAFRLAYRASFVAKCTGVSATAAAEHGLDSSKLCSCAVDRLMVDKSIVALRQPLPTADAQSAIKACLATGR